MASSLRLDVARQSLYTSHRAIVHSMFPEEQPTELGPRGVHEPKRLVKTMNYDVETADYNVAEFYERFGKELPQVVMINQGFFGDIVEDTFDREMIIRIQTVSKQRRVIARADMGDHAKLISIPLTYPEKVCVVKKHKLSKEKTIKAVLDGHSLPCQVEFPKDRTISVGGQNISTNHIPKLQLQEAFDEMYLLGNFIIDGVMGPEVVNVPLYLSQLRLARVTGLKDQPPQKWRGYLEELARFSSYLKYDKEYGNQGIAQYDPSAVHSDAVYSYVEPRLYSNIASVFRHVAAVDRYVPSVDNPSYQPTDDPQDESVKYEEIGIKRESVEYNEITDYQKSPMTTFGGNSGKTQLKSVKGVSGEQPEKKAGVSHASQQKTSPTPPAPVQSVGQSRVGQEPRTDPHALQQTNNSPVPRRTGKGLPQIATKPRRAPPAVPEQGSPKVPERQPRPPTQILNPVPKRENIYSNDLPRTSIHPIRQELIQAFEKHMHEDSSKSATNSDTVNSTEKPDKLDKPLPTVGDNLDVLKLSINDVCGYLKVLRLDKYEEAFRENMIDGPLLVELTKENFEQEFGMTGLEAVRILKFSKEGHLPR